jgi:hypothetical protein
LCCSLPLIEALDKPAYHACHHIEGGGCRIFGMPDRPSACGAYHCAYLASALARHPDRHLIPHPLDCGAYGHRDPVEPVFLVFVDPDRPERWKSSAFAAYCRGRLMQGEALFITDRGRQMVIRDLATLDLVLARDLVALADADGRALDLPSFLTRRSAVEET